MNPGIYLFKKKLLVFFLFTPEVAVGHILIKFFFNLLIEKLLNFPSGYENKLVSLFSSFFIFLIQSSTSFFNSFSLRNVSIS